MRFGSRITAAATTGPASGPRPASSQPATGHIPLPSARALAPERRTHDLLAERQAVGDWQFGGGSPTHRRRSCALLLASQ